jgi:mycothiol system anti-sigma-R factor
MADEVNCSSVVEELYTFLDGELTEAKRIEITQHVHGCNTCHEVIEFHAELKMVIADRCREQVPDRLRERIARVLGLPQE